MNKPKVRIEIQCEDCDGNLMFKAHECQDGSIEIRLPPCGCASNE